MRAPDDMTALAELLQRQAQHVVKDGGGPVLLALPGLLSFVEREPRLAGLVHDLREEAGEHWEAYELECREVLAEMRTIWAEANPALERLRAADAEDACLWSEMGFDDLPDRLDAEPQFERQYTTKQPEAVQELLPKLRYFVDCGQGHEAGTWREPGLRALCLRLNHLVERLGRAWTVRRLRLESEGGAAYVELRQQADDLVPGMTDGDDGLVVAARNQRTEKRWQDIEAYRHWGDVPEARSALRDFSATGQLVEVLHLALQTKLAEGRSRAAVVRRYAARCETFDRGRLLEVIEAAASKRKVEEVLTLDFARYLFDVGFNPIVDPKIAELRPDVLDPSLAPGMYVEAKQYKRPNARDIRTHVAQVFDTWGRLRNHYDLPEAFLLIFRRSGPLVELPPDIKVKGRRLRLHVVDVAPSDQAGSQAKQSPLVLEEADLLPAEAAS